MLRAFSVLLVLLLATAARAGEWTYEAAGTAMGSGRARGLRPQRFRRRGASAAIKAVLERCD